MRSGAALAQWASRSVSFCGCGGSGCGERIRIAPSLRRSTATSARPELHRPQRRPVLRQQASSPARSTCQLARHFGAALFEKRLEPRLGLVVALRDRRGQRFGGKAGGGIAAGDARQHVRHREIGERRIAGDAVREFDALGEALAFVDQILREPDRLALLGGERAPGQHHVHHARGADQRRQPHRTAAADEDAAAGFGQRVKGGTLGHPHMGRGGEFEPAADHRAMQHGDDRHRCRTRCARRRDARTANARRRQRCRARSVRSDRARR